VRVAAVLDRYFWRIGDRTWRGRASNACLDRVGRELRAEAKRNTAVVIHEIRSARESRVPIIRIGSRTAFSPEGVVPVVVRAAGAGVRHKRSESERARLAIVRIAILFHDLGKATILFQEKLRRGLKKQKPEADPVRHELFSAVVWDELVGALDDTDLIGHLSNLKPSDIDEACERAIDRLRRLRDAVSKGLPQGALIGLAFASQKSSSDDCHGTIAYAVGMLILTHHRLPDGSKNHMQLLAEQHVNPDAKFDADDLKVAKGCPFWHSEKWFSRLRKAVECLQPGRGAPGLDIALRASLMFSDHLGSALSEARDVKSAPRNEHLGNTRDGKPADSLEVHVNRVWQRALGSYDMLHRHRERYPALDEDQVPIDIRHPEPAHEPFAWQEIAANEARKLCESREGGFFACLMAGTGTGKTRGAPTVLGAAAFADARSERRYLRMTLALGLRSLATQSANEYVDDLQFDRSDVSVLVGQPPVRFKDDDEENSFDGGSESLLALPEWLRVERAGGGPPPEGDEREADWLRRLSVDTDRGLPATLDRILEHDRTGGRSARLLAVSPIIVGTIDHLMDVASPVRSRYLIPALRVLTSDLILDEIDQYEPEDIAAIGRLVYQAAAGGRRVIIMSATLPDDVAYTLHEAYRRGWSAYATAFDLDDHVNVLCCSEATGSCATNVNCEAFETLYENSRTATVSALEVRPPQRPGKILPACKTWNELIDQIDTEIGVLHDATAGDVEALKVSIGFVRMTRIAHTAALAVQLPAGPRNDRLRLKVCLHAQFPRLHRAWIENELKRALTRKDGDPNAGLRSFCKRHGLLERMRAAGCRELEIVINTSPVIETGNDLDFDWGIIDPSSMRTIVQGAGRVWRHREYRDYAPNVAILGRSAVVMQRGKLEMPGVETRPHGDTKIARVDLDDFGDRLLVDLAGSGTFDCIDARAILGDGSVPLRDKEAELRRRFIEVTGDEAPLGTYIRHPTTRLNRRITRTRVFRRSTTRDLLYFKYGEDLRNAIWMLDLAPGNRSIAPSNAQQHGLQAVDASEPNLVFLNLDELAWQSQRQEVDTPATSQIRRLTEVRVPEFGDQSEQIDPIVTYGEWTGFTRGSPEDLSGPFGKANTD